MASSKHVYTSEISNMVYVITGIREPDEELAHYLEDVTRSHIIELVIQARTQASRRASRIISVEDLIFLVRHDRAKVNRLRSYLSWKDVRKKRVMEPEADEDIDGMEEPVSDKALKVLKTTVRLPWELGDAWADYLRGEDEPEDDEAEAFRVNKQRLKEAEEVTRNMTKDEYEHYASARQASFVYRKAKKFRDFLTLPLLLDSATSSGLNDEVLDVLGFLAYECVRALCDAGIATRRAGESAKSRVKEFEKRREAKRKLEIEGAGAGEEANGETTGAAVEGSSPAKEGSSPSKKAKKSGEGTSASQAAAALDRASPNANTANKPLELPISLFSAPIIDVAPTPSLPSAAALSDVAGAGGAGGRGGALPPMNLKLEDVMQGYQAVQHSQMALKLSGMRNWRGGVGRLSNRLV